MSRARSGDRIPLGRGSIRSAAGAGGRSGSRRGGRDCRAAARRGACSKSGDHDDSDRLLTGGDPVKLAWSLASTGRAATSRASTFYVAELGAKRLELLHELVPKARYWAAGEPEQSDAEAQIKGATSGSEAWGATSLLTTAAADIDRAFAALVETQAGALFFSSDAF